MKKLAIFLTLLAFCVQAQTEDGGKRVSKKGRVRKTPLVQKGALKQKKPVAAKPASNQKLLEFERPGATGKARAELLEKAIEARLKGRKVLSLDEVLEEALEKSTTLKTAQLSLENMVENVRQAKYLYIPEFAIEAKGAQNDLSAAKKKDDYEEEVVKATATISQHLPGNIDITGAAEFLQNDRLSDTETLRISISKEILRPDNVSHTLALAKLKLDLQRVSHEETRRRFIYEVKVAYYDYLRAWLLYLNAQAQFQADQKLNQESENKYAAGIIAQYQLLDYQRDFTESELSLARHEVAWKTSRNALLFLMQQPLDSQIEVRPEMGKADIRREWDAKVMIDSALRTSLSVASLRESLLSSEKNLEYARKILRPSLSIFGSIEDEQVTPLKGADKETSLSSVGIRIMLPLFQKRFIDRSQVRTQMNDVELGTLQLEESFRLYQRIVADDLLALKLLRKSYELAEKKFRITYVDYELGKLRFETGTIGSYDMIRNKNNFFNANSRTIDLKYQLLKTEARFERDYPVVVETEDINNE